MLVSQMVANGSAVEGPSGPRWRPNICLRQALWKVSNCVPCVSEGP